MPEFYDRVEGPWSHSATTLGRRLQPGERKRAQSTKPRSGPGSIAAASPPDRIRINPPALADLPAHRLRRDRIREALESLLLIGARQALFKERGRLDLAPHRLPAHHVAVAVADGEHRGRAVAEADDLEARPARLRSVVRHQRGDRALPAIAQRLEHALQVSRLERAEQAPVGAAVGRARVARGAAVGPGAVEGCVGAGADAREHDRLAQRRAPADRGGGIAARRRGGAAVVAAGDAVEERKKREEGQRRKKAFHRCERRVAGAASRRNGDEPTLSLPRAPWIS